jgi:hypothetical protein
MFYSIDPWFTVGKIIPMTLTSHPINVTDLKTASTTITITRRRRREKKEK